MRWGSVGDKMFQRMARGGNWNWGSFILTYETFLENLDFDDGYFYGRLRIEWQLGVCCVSIDEFITAIHLL